MAPPKKTSKEGPLTASFITGAIALVFLIIGYQAALFVHKAAVTRLVANRDRPDTVYVYVTDSLPSFVPSEDTPFLENNQADARKGVSPSGTLKAVRKNAPHSPEAVALREKAAPRAVESFRFNPNTASVEDLRRLGFSEKQAAAIDHYRQKGGRYRRPSDFAKSFVVADSVFERLAPYIDIPRLDINQADSVALLDLPGIGPYFAGKMVQYRRQLRGYSTVEQLLEIWHFDQEKLDALRDLITCSPPAPYPLWTLPEDSLAQHPHISRAEAHSIVLYRQHHAPDACTLDALRAAGLLSEDHYHSLSLCWLASAKE